VAHAGFGSPHEGAVAENHPGLLRSGKKTIPKGGKNCRRGLAFARLLAAGPRTAACEERDDRDRGGQQNGKRDDDKRPVPLLVIFRVIPGFKFLPVRALRLGGRGMTRMKRNGVAAFWYLDDQV